jgi:hypothetical protein
MLLWKHMKQSQQSYLSKIQGVVWSRDAGSLDMEKDKAYIIHQILMYGSLEDMQWLKRTYSLQNIKDTFMRQPSKVYTPQAFHFVTHAFLHLQDNEQPDEQSYLKTTPRYS